MHSEYAVEPSVIGSDWPTFRYLIEKFGFDKGRLISRFPSRWERKVVAAAKDANLTDIQISSIIERLKGTKKTRVFDLGRDFEYGDDWIDNALREHAKRAFRGIIFAKKPTGCPEALTVDDCDDENPLFKVSTSRDVSRVADEISDALLLLLAPATEIDVVDPFFDVRPRKGDFLGPIAALLAKLSDAGFSEKTLRIHYRTHASRPTDAQLAQDAPGLTAGLIPPGFKLQLFEWEKIEGGKDFHDRFVLTNFGGIQIGIGPAAAEASQDTTFTLLDDDHAQKLRARFEKDATVYNRIGHVVEVDSFGDSTLL